jgi:hypothetical protein
MLLSRSAAPNGFNSSGVHGDFRERLPSRSLVSRGRSPRAPARSVVLLARNLPNSVSQLPQDAALAWV